MSRGHVMPSEESTLIRLPPPLRGRVGERGKPRAPIKVVRRQSINERRKMMSEDASASPQTTEQAAPLSLTLPRKGGGNPSASAPLANIGSTIASELPQ
ncbi:hypothetical protein V1278_001460 [Bradyrhizobium sp. AZCC 1577]